MSNKLLFKNGTYSGITAETHFFNELTFNLTNYSNSKANNEFHSHTDAHIGFVLHGNYIENRKNQEFYRKTGDLVFCNAFESHKFQTHKIFRNLNNEISNKFLNRYDIDENQIENNLKANSNAKTNILKMFFELDQKDENIETTLILLVLDIIKPNIEKSIAQNPNCTYCLKEIISDKWKIKTG